jgi:peptidyl-prolyl cis-trans isomerase SurA
VQGRGRGGVKTTPTKLQHHATRERTLPRRRQSRSRLWLAAGLLTLLAAALGAAIVDRVVAVVGQQAIAASEVETQLRLEAMFNREPLDITAEKRRQGLQRLIAVRLIQGEAIMAGFLKVSETEVQRRLEESKQERYLNGVAFEDALKLYDLREQDVTDFWRQVIGYERFKDFRFKTGLEVSREEVSAYYESHIVPEFRAEGNGSPPPLDDIYDKVEQAVIEERANALLDEWLKETRPQTRIVILEERQPTQEQAAPASAPTTPTGAAPR